MDIFGTKIAGLQTKVEELEGAVTSLTVERDTAITEAATLQGKLTAAANAKTAAEQALASANDAHAKALADAKAEHEKALEQAKADHAKKVEDEVISRIASAGIEPVRRDPSAANGDGGGNLTEQLALITDPAARTSFMQKHAAALMAEARRKP